MFIGVLNVIARSFNVIRFRLDYFFLTFSFFYFLHRHQTENKKLEMIPMIVTCYFIGGSVLFFFFFNRLSFFTMFQPDGFRPSSGVLRFKKTKKSRKKEKVTDSLVYKKKKKLGL